MKVVCRHGHFAFYPHEKEEVLRFKRLFGKRLAAEEDYFTFEGLAGLPRWSQIGRPYALGQPPAIVTFEGRHPWEMMEANGVVYSLFTGLLMPFISVVQFVTLPATDDCVVAPRPLIQPGAILPGNFLLGYQGELDLEFQKLYIYSKETLL